MCEPASVMTALKVAVTVFSAYTAVKGLSEGNIMQAVVGGIGAYAGFTSLQASYGSQLGNATGSVGEVSGNLADATAAGTESAFTTPAKAVSEGFVDAVAEVPGTAGIEATIQSGLENGASVLGEPLTAATPMSGQFGAGINSNLTQNLQANALESVNTGLLNNPQANALQQTANANINPPEANKNGLMTDLKEGYEGLKGLLGDNQQLLGYGLQYSGAKEQQDFLEKQLKEREQEEERLRQYAATAPTFKYNYGV